MLPSLHSLRTSDLARQTARTDGSLGSLLMRSADTQPGELEQLENAQRQLWKMGEQRLKDGKGEDIQQIITTLRNFADPPDDLADPERQRAVGFANKWSQAVAANMRAKTEYYLKKSRTTALKVSREQDFIIECRGLKELTVQERLAGKKDHPIVRAKKIRDAHGVALESVKDQEHQMKRMLGKSKAPSGRGQLGGDDEMYLGADQYGNVDADSTVVNPLFKGEEVGASEKMENLIARQVVQETLSQRCALRAKEAEGWAAKDVAELQTQARSLALTLDNLRTTFHRESTLLTEVSKTVYTFVQSGGNTDGLLPHIALMGEPGIGKTLLAELLARLLSELGVLMHSTHANVTVTDFVGEYLGQTAPKTEKLLEENLERVVFFDEAYALTRGVQSQTRDAKAAAAGDGSGSGDNLYGQEAVDKLVPFLWDERGRMIMIVAGYQHQIEKEFLATNIGLQSRFQLQIVLNPYPAPQMVEIYLKSIARGFRFDRRTGLRTAFNMFSPRARYLLQAIVEKAREWTLRTAPETGGAASRSFSLPPPAAAPPASSSSAAGPSGGSMVATADDDDESDGEDNGGGDTGSALRKSNDKYARQMPAHCERSYKHLYRLLEAHGRSMDSLASQTRKLVEESLAKAGQDANAYDKVYLTDVNVLEIFDSQIDAVLGGGDSDTAEVALSTGTDGGMLTNAQAARLELRTLLLALGLIDAVSADSEIQDAFKLQARFPPFESQLTTVLLGEGTEKLQSEGYAGSMAASDHRSQDDDYLHNKYPPDHGKQRYLARRRNNPEYVDKKENYDTSTFWHQVFPEWDTMRKERNRLQWGKSDGNERSLGDFETWVTRTYPWSDRSTKRVTETSYEQAQQNDAEAAKNYREYLDAMVSVAGHGEERKARATRSATAAEVAGQRRTRSEGLHAEGAEEAEPLARRARRQDPSDAGE
jgi:SpoVK/Ycf46/Vps4 family AAA+-type ATPase